jgi:hypothetical protein
MTSKLFYIDDIDMLCSCHNILRNLRQRPSYVKQDMHSARVSTL